MKSKEVAYLLWIFTGLWGGHKFYLNNIGMGLVYLFTFGLFGIGWFVDVFTLSDQVDSANAKTLGLRAGLADALQSTESLRGTVAALKNNFISSAEMTPEKQVLNLTKDTNFLTLRDVVSNTSLTLDEAETILNKMVEKGIAKLSEDKDGARSYYFY